MKNYIIIALIGTICALGIKIHDNNKTDKVYDIALGSTVKLNEFYSNTIDIQSKMIINLKSEVDILEKLLQPADESTNQGTQNIPLQPAI